MLPISPPETEGILNLDLVSLPRPERVVGGMRCDGDGDAPETKRSHDRPKNGIFLDDLSSKLVILGAHLLKLGVGLLRRS